ncbi:AMP-dependent synthetase [Bacteroidetes bacterium UKL13-3]|nr:AMP-dependent synthetase [Bacteroidetes bacterium UKL13-3]HCP94751.1 long-chain fatty acid--CoA ligase [Bacteroidota bacterium]
MEPTRLFDLLPRYEKLFNKKDMLTYKVNGVWKSFSASEVVDDANLISYALFDMGLNKGDKLSIISPNRPEWVITNMGIMEAGCINVPIYPTISQNDLVYILNDAEVKYVFVPGQELYDKVNAVRSKLSGLIDIITFDNVEGATDWNSLLVKGRECKNKEKLEEIKASIDTHDCATILYTSGTTGNPKGVMLSHNNLLSNAIANKDAALFGKDWKVLSFLPLNHVFERMLTVLYLYQGLSIYYAESMDKIADNLKEVQPNCFASVPRLLEKVYERIVAKGHELTGIKKQLFFWALNLGLRYELNGANGWWYEAQLKLANKLIFSKWREALGGKVEVIVSGGAALQPRLARVFTAANIPVLEGYGLTETSPVVAVNSFQPNSVYFGTVGPVIKGVEVKFAPDGEILVKGPNVMLGYYKKPAETAEVMEDGWFKTGDIGELVEGRFLKITDRKKEIFKTSGGKFIKPQLIENMLKESPYIEQTMVIGEGHKFPAALIVPAFAALKSWCERNSIEYTTNENMITKDFIIQKMRKQVDVTNRYLAQFEMIKEFALIPHEWSIDGGELTPKLSLRRKEIMRINEQLIHKIYSSETRV